MRAGEILTDMNELPTRGKFLPTKNVEGENVFPVKENLVGKKVYHYTRKKFLPSIEKNGLRMREDRSGTREFAMDTVKLGRDFRAVKGVFFATPEDYPWGVR